MQCCTVLTFKTFRVGTGHEYDLSDRCRCPPKVYHSLTPRGRMLVGLADAIQVWVETNIEAVRKAHQACDSRSPDSGRLLMRR